MTLTLINSWTLPLDEVSGLSLRRIPARAETEILAIDDALFDVAGAAVRPGQLRVRPPLANVRPAMAAHGILAGRSDFEAIASDSSGRVFIMCERAARILVFSADLATLVQTITLDVKPSGPGSVPGWAGAENSRGEGLLLMKNGHVLVAKQTNPPGLIEFGPTVNEPSGFHPGSALAQDELFPLPAGDITFTPRAWWPIASARRTPSINDLEVDALGRLYMVSSSARALGRLTINLTVPAHDAVFEIWPLPVRMPRTRKDLAEGLVFVPEIGWLVALDRSVRATNVYAIAGIPA
jgi:hypothetical protein